MTNLNKPDFWDPLREIAPDAVDRFCKWIDEYKKEVGWAALFGGDPAIVPKFHDLPFDMQIGVIARFELDMIEPQDFKEAQESAAKYWTKRFKARMIMFQHNLEAKKDHLVDKINKEQGN